MQQALVIMVIRGDQSEQRGLLTGAATHRNCEWPISNLQLPNWVLKACLLDG